ncbi:MAG: BadF/BadG/BcrA/BcrD ATPase family protein, partial [Planctomycetota bacterium]
MRHDTRWVGLDVGSTTVKVTVVDPTHGACLFSDYQRHNAQQNRIVREMLEGVHDRYADVSLALAVCGSGGQPFATALNAFFVQEVVANAVAVKALHNSARVAIELGGQDAKVIFFQRDPHTGDPIASDMRMNGSCAGGTGAFLDQIAELLQIPIEEFEALANQGKTVYDISGRCGVFAKTDIQPLLNRGVDTCDIALSAFHAIAKQTLGGLAQGMPIQGPVIFEGGPLTFNPTLIRVFQERLALSADEVILPERAETIIAYGAALSIGQLFHDQPRRYEGREALKALAAPPQINSTLSSESTTNFFDSPDERATFHQRYPRGDFDAPPRTSTPLRATLGVDAGSTTLKFVLLNESGEVLYKFYAGNGGSP